VEQWKRASRPSTGAPTTALLPPQHWQSLRLLLPAPARASVPCFSLPRCCCGQWRPVGPGCSPCLRTTRRRWSMSEACTAMRRRVLPAQPWLEFLTGLVQALGHPAPHRHSHRSRGRHRPPPVRRWLLRRHPPPSEVPLSVAVAPLCRPLCPPPPLRVLPPARPPQDLPALWRVGTAAGPWLNRPPRPQLAPPWHRRAWGLP
jgi:hypothetical protein